MRNSQYNSAFAFWSLKYRINPVSHSICHPYYFLNLRFFFWLVFPIFRWIKTHRAKEREVVRKTRMEKYFLSMLASIMLSIVSNYLEILQGTYSASFNQFQYFLVAKLLYNYLCPSVCMYVCLSVRFRGKRDFLSLYLR